ncbi:MAG: universal stress protein [Candidatus Eremiobacteraeota bacterium]|nr:universal stress protein [Candidatus Eremiobacteraeota bacterium]MCW5872833.1 universal stress protein [Candidatus Eremiobacteraeota bacterium]
MFFKIVVPLDGSIYSEAALKSASFMARAFNAELKLVTVEDIPLPIYPGEVDAEMISEIEKDHQAYLNARAHELREEGCCVSTVVLPPGSPADRILDEVKKERADLIVVGSHGRTGLTRMLLGSVAEKLARHAPCPVMIARVQEVPAAV